jgi:hypothetical protein
MNKYSLSFTPFGSQVKAVAELEKKNAEGQGKQAVGECPPHIWGDGLFDTEPCIICGEKP